MPAARDVNVTPTRESKGPDRGSKAASEVPFIPPRPACVALRRAPGGPSAPHTTTTEGDAP